MMIDSLKNIYPIIKNNGRYEFEYNIFPLSMDRFTFEDNKTNLLDIFSNDASLVLFIKEIELKMKEAASLCKFETASMYRDIIFSLNYLKSGINGYKNMFTKDIVLKIQTQNGYKLFFVKKGQILLKKSYKNHSKKYIDAFINKGTQLCKINNTTTNEKISIDYRDILYSEISGAPGTIIFTS